MLRYRHRAPACRVRKPLPSSGSLWPSGLQSDATATRLSSSRSLPASRSVESFAGRGCYAPLAIRSISTNAVSRASQASASAAVAKDLQCAGCGVQLQTRDKVAAGYIPSLAQLDELKKQSLEAASKDSSFAGHNLICQRCFTSKHYGKLMPLNIPQEAWSAYVKGLSQLKRGCIVLVVDAYDVHDTLGVLATARELLDAAGTGGTRDGEAVKIESNGAGSKGIKIFASSPESTARLTRATSGDSSHAAAKAEAAEIPLLVVVNKVDLLPTSLSHARLEAWIRGQINSLTGPSSSPSSGRYNVIGVHCVSAAKRYGIRDLVQSLQKHKNDPIRPSVESQGKADPSSSSYRGDVYVIGAPNTGKSTLINAILSEIWHTPMPDKRGSNNPSRDDSDGDGDSKPLRPEDDPDVLVPEVTAAAAAGGVEASLEVVDDGQRHNMRSKQSSLSSLVFSPYELTAARKSLDDKYKMSAHRQGTQPSETELVAEILRLRRKAGAAPGSTREDSSSSSIDKETMSMLDDVLAGHIARKKGYGKTRGREGGKEQASSRYEAVETLLKQQRQQVQQEVSDTENTSAATDAEGRPSQSDNQQLPSGEDKASLPAPPIPFTTSPLPGTTLGLLGAQMDPHGHSRIWDTPGLIVDDEKQALLESVAAVPAEDEGEDAASTTDEGTAKASTVRPIVFAATSRLSALVPGPSSSTAALLHGSPSTRAPVPLSSPAASASSSHASNMRVYKLVPGRSLYLGGLARIDYDHVRPEIEQPQPQPQPLQREPQRHARREAKPNKDGSISLDLGGHDDHADRDDRDADDDIPAAGRNGGAGAYGAEKGVIKTQLPSLLVTVCSRLPVHLTRSDAADMLWLRHCANNDASGKLLGASGDEAGDEQSASATAQAVDLFQSPSSRNKKGSASSDAASFGLLRPYYKPLLNVGAVSLLRWTNPLQARAIVESEAYAIAKRLLLSSSDEVSSYASSGGQRGLNSRDALKAAEKALQEAIAAHIGSRNSHSLRKGGSSYPLAVRSVASMEETRQEILRDEDRELKEVLKGFSPLVHERVRTLLSQVTQGRETLPSMAVLERRLQESSIVNPTSSATIERRKKRTRHNLVDLALGGLGWVSVTPIEVEGMWGWSRTVSGAVLGVAVSDGVSAVARQPLVGDTATGLSSKEWGQ